MTTLEQAQQALDAAVMVANETIDSMLRDVARPSRCSTIDEFVRLDEFVYEVEEHIERTGQVPQATELAAWMLEEFYSEEES